MKKKIKILKQNGELEYFSEAKLKSSLKRSGANRKITEKVLEQIESHLKEGMSTSEIYRKAYSVLNLEQRKVATSYSLRNAVMALGPTGFPFERFVGEVLKDKGFEVVVGSEVMGECVSHEVDVLAFSKEKMLMVEAKFHNSHGTKSDLKVALYVKARFDDIKNTTFNFQGRKRKPDEGWLVTNTKFSKTAIKYGECKNLKMIGWNYPKEGNLQDMIEESAVHPLTALKSLSQNQKKALLNRNVVLCKNLVKDPESLKALGLKDDKIKKIQGEVKNICYP